MIPIFDKSVNRYVYIGVLEYGLVDVWQEVEDRVADPSCWKKYLELLTHTYFPIRTVTRNESQTRRYTSFLTSGFTPVSFTLGPTSTLHI